MSFAPIRIHADFRTPYVRGYQKQAARRRFPFDAIGWIRCGEERAGLVCLVDLSEKGVSFIHKEQLVSGVNVELELSRHSTGEVFNVTAKVTMATQGLQGWLITCEFATPLVDKAVEDLLGTTTQRTTNS